MKKILPIFFLLLAGITCSQDTAVLSGLQQWLKEYVSGKPGMEELAPGEVLKQLENGLARSRELGKSEMTLDSYAGLSRYYRGKGDFKKSYEFLSMFSSLKDSLLSEEKSRNLTEMQKRFETEKKQRERESLLKEQEIDKLKLSEHEANLRKQKVILFISLGGVVLVLALVFIIFWGFIQKKKANLLLEDKNAAILQQKEILEEKNTLITDSIEYARGIQETILPPVPDIKRILPESFILYRPKDIVAGDFYWISHPGQGSSGKQSAASSSSPSVEKGTRNLQQPLFIAACDCTGHGVPGAFMSMHGYYLLERIMKENDFSHPNEVLDRLNTQMMETLHQAQGKSSAKYGIDMALLKITGNSIEYSGARNPLLIIHESRMEEIKADRIYIGGSGEKFSNKVITPPPGSMLYIFTDGYADQKGGPEGKKMFAAGFRDLLMKVSGKPVDDQLKILEQSFNEWRGSAEQVDDVLIIGIRV